MDNELSTGYDISSSIPIPSMPASFYPGKAPISAFLSGSAQSAAATGSASSASVAGKNVVASAGSSAAPTYVASTSSSAAPVAQATSGSQGGSGGNGGWDEPANAQITPAANGNFGWGKRSAKFRN